MSIIVRTQAELDAAFAADENATIEIQGEAELSLSIGGRSAPFFTITGGAAFHLVAWGSSQPRVEARESSQPRVEARESSQPRVVAWGSSQPRVEARESSQPRVEARESSQPRVEAWGYVQLSLLGRVIAKAAASVAVLIEGKAEVGGGQQTHVSRATPQQWCDYYGVKVVDGVATLYKALNDDFTSPHGMSYAPGTTPVAPDWDDGERECGGGLHFSPSAAMAREFNRDATKFVACPVALDDIVVRVDAQMPQKIKARGCCGPCVEVDEDGADVVAQPEEVAA